MTADKQQPPRLSSPFATMPYRKRRAYKGSPSVEGDCRRRSVEDDCFQSVRRTAALQSEARWRILAVNGKVMATSHSEWVIDLVFEALMVEYRNKKAKKA